MRAVSLSLAALVSIATLSCGEDAPDPNDEVRRDLLETFADGFQQPELTALAEASVSLETATAAYAESLDPADLATAQAAWRETMRVTERLELGQVGPAGLLLGTMGGIVGGEERRVAIYSWPSNSPCNVDQATVTEAHADPALLEAEPVGTRGLDAIEYLLFTEDPGNQCSSISGINTDGTWAAVEAEIPTRRAVHAATAATLVRQTAEVLRDRWFAEPDPYRETLVTAGEGSALYVNERQAVSNVFGAFLVYLEDVKGMKVGQPAGLVSCLVDDCLAFRESLYADASVAHIQENLAAFGTIWRGPSGTGFDDLLIAVGAPDLADRIDAAIDTAVAEAAALEGTIPEILAADPNGLMPLFDALQALLDLLKAEAIAVLDIDLTGFRSDND